MKPSRAHDVSSPDDSPWPSRSPAPAATTSSATRINIAVATDLNLDESNVVGMPSPVCPTWRYPRFRAARPCRGKDAGIREPDAWAHPEVNRAAAAAGVPRETSPGGTSPGEPPLPLVKLPRPPQADPPPPPTVRTSPPARAKIPLTTLPLPSGSACGCPRLRPRRLFDNCRSRVL